MDLEFIRLVFGGDVQNNTITYCRYFDKIISLVVHKVVHLTIC